MLMCGVRAAADWQAKAWCDLVRRQRSATDLPPAPPCTLHPPGAHGAQQQACLCTARGPAHLLELAGAGPCPACPPCLL
jgi:hypothetical protein